MIQDLDIYHFDCIMQMRLLQALEYSLSTQAPIVSQDLDICNNDCKQFIKKIRRRIPSASRQGGMSAAAAGAASLLFDEAVQQSLLTCADQIHKVVTTLQDLSQVRPPF